VIHDLQQYKQVCVIKSVLLINLKILCSGDKMQLLYLQHWLNNLFC